MFDIVPPVQLGFFCYDLNYEQMASQMGAVKLQFLHNFWSYV